MGLEVPVVCEQIYPGDRFRVGLTYQMQLAPMLNPVYDGLEVNFEAFFVPNRIIDKRWKEFWTGYNEFDQMTQTDLAPLTLTTLYLNTPENLNEVDKTYLRPIGIGSLFDFLGVQFASYNDNGTPDIGYNVPNPNIELNINLLPFLAYNRIYDDWYRNERTQQARLYYYYNNAASTQRTFSSSYNYEQSSLDFVQRDNYNDIPVHFFNRNYKKDKFTTALPEPVIGGDVHIPVNSEGFSYMYGSSQGKYSESLINDGTSSGPFSLNTLALGTIEQLKFAFKEYSYRMKDTYNGNRYVESIESHYGIRVPDSTLQRSYYLGSSRDYVNFGEVYQTSSGDGQGTNGALGDYAGRGGSSGTHNLFDETFYEHGYMFVLMCVNPISRYFQGVKRMFTRFDRADYFEPEYQNIGDDFISVSELYNTGDSAHNDRVFGFNSRWIDMKVRTNELHGEFAHPGSMLYQWNFSRSFGVEPTVSSEFSEIVPINKPFVDSSIREDNYFVDVYVDMQALRPVLATESF